MSEEDMSKDITDLDATELAVLVSLLVKTCSVLVEKVETLEEKVERIDNSSGFYKMRSSDVTH